MHQIVKTAINYQPSTNLTTHRPNSSKQRAIHPVHANQSRSAPLRQTIRKSLIGAGLRSPVANPRRLAWPTPDRPSFFPGLVRIWKSFAQSRTCHRLQLASSLQLAANRDPHSTRATPPPPVPPLTIPRAQPCTTVSSDLHQRINRRTTHTSSSLLTAALFRTCILAFDCAVVALAFADNSLERSSCIDVILPSVPRAFSIGAFRPAGRPGPGHFSQGTSALRTCLKQRQRPWSDAVHTFICIIRWCHDWCSSCASLLIVICGGIIFLPLSQAVANFRSDHSTPPHHSFPVGILFLHRP